MMMVVVDEENDNDGIGPGMGPRQVKAVIKLMRLLKIYVQGENDRGVQRCWIHNRFWGGNFLLSFTQVTLSE